MKRNWCLLGVLAVLFFGTLWVRPLANPDEGRYSEVPREMVESGDWVVPRLNGVIYFEKPPLAYWINAIAIKFLGTSLPSVRFPNALMAFLTCALIMIAGTALYGKKQAFWGTFALGSSGLFFGMSQVMTVDMTLTACLTLTWVSFIMAVRKEGLLGNPSVHENRRVPEPSQEKRHWKAFCRLEGDKMPSEREFFWKGFGKTNFCKKWFSRWTLAFYAAIALAVLAKGLVGVLIPVCVIGLWVVLFRQWRVLRGLLKWEGVVVFLAIVLPWHILVIWRQPGFAWFYFVHEHFLRYLTPIHCREQPVYFLILAFLLGLAPWVFFGGYAVRGLFRKTDGKRNPLEAFLALWGVFVVVFFSISKSKLIPYILPAIPPVALLIGARVHDIWEGVERGRCLRFLFAFMGSVLVVAGCVGSMILMRRTEMDVAAMPMIYSVLKWVVIAGGVGILYGAIKKQYRVCLGVLVTMIASLMLSLNSVAQFIQRQGTLECAEVIKKSIQPGDRVFAFYDYFQDLPYYLQQTIGLVDVVPSEQEFGTQLEFPKDRYIRAAQLKSVCEKKRIYGVVKSNHFERMFSALKEIPVHILMRNKDFVLWSNQQ